MVISMSAATTKKTAFVFGSQLSSLISALHFQRLGYKVTLYDVSQSFSAESPRFISSILNFVPDSQRTHEALAFLSELLGQQIGFEDSEQAPKLVSAEKTIDFVGFGDKKYPSLPAISQLNQRAQLLLDTPIESLALRALELFDGEIKSYSQITSIDFNADGIEALQINGGKKQYADLYVFTQTPRELIELLPDEVLGSRLRSKLARTEVYGRLSLKTHDSFDTSELAELVDNFLFFIPQAADFEPCMGYINKSQSQWHSYMNSELAEDPEKLAGQVRHMRKIIERALPSLQGALKTASISFEKEDFASYDSSSILANLLKSNENMLFASSLWSEIPGLIGCLDALMLNLQIRAETSKTTDNLTSTPSQQPTSLGPTAN